MERKGITREREGDDGGFPDSNWETSNNRVESEHSEGSADCADPCQNPQSALPKAKREDVAIPESLKTQEFQAAWDEFVQHRVALRKKLTPQAIRQQLNKLEAMGVARAIVAITHSIANGWTGIFEPGPSGLDSRSKGQLPSARRLPTPDEANRPWREQND